ncbi:DNA adenine methylase [Gramella sp. Hel_I_59]|uniref:DNA adenine methylase n=1 Tax=Gramella sp. Hel_I_59 TaxID=1249978 RepID=UPI00115098D8|nr:Dam family site-specific DNA-(adenine-N6)-methyltransferase [Gramella sp. Hel_I_59]TQI71437.1 DNA adenine methylase [Gramella sp. Hel_I_59]
MIDKEVLVEKPFLRWAGGKQKLITEIINNLPSNTITNYFEPFLGAGSLFFQSSFPSSTISDVNFPLINSYNSIKSNFEKISELLKFHAKRFERNHEYYYKIREDYNKNIRRSGYEQAGRFIFLIHTNYNGMYRINKRGSYNVPLGKTKPSLPAYDHLSAISLKLQDTTILARDYKSVVTDIKRNDFVYMDPPYPPYDWSNHQRQYTKDHFTKNDHLELAEYASNLANNDSYVLISYPDIEFIRKQYKHWNIIQLDTVRSISGKKIRKKIPEIIIKNY